MKKRHMYRVVDHAFLESAPIRVTVDQDLDCSPERLFEIFEDAEAWTDWLFLDDVTWTTEPPIQAGSARTVVAKPFEFDEVFTRWDDAEGLSFYFASGTTGMVAAFFEDYRVTRLGENRCHITWDVAIEMKSPASLMGPIIGAVFKFRAVGAYKKLAKYVVAHP